MTGEVDEGVLELISLRCGGMSDKKVREPLLHILPNCFKSEYTIGGEIMGEAARLI